ncbi:hypothetical protein cand_024600 [Cryptosporidium andersoni]|uniref:Uncharacterized protein n=1 Tax=Cryptosporidium andersoni TaxID=117008 RepID=A0A1J4MRU0_9CRYT|nr:hypothetical protein cand_024600 [Cryptosporidium andersoni]
MTFGILVPGRAVSAPVQESECRWIAELPQPSTIHNLTIFLNQPLPTDQCGAGIYYSFAPFTSWEFLGVITNVRPSDMFTTGWPFLPDIMNLATVRIGITIELSSELIVKVENKPPIDINKEVAKKIALNLFRFIESFNGNNINSSECIRVPQMVLDRWFVKFEEKYNRDPYFYMNTN